MKMILKSCQILLNNVKINQKRKLTNIKNNQTKDLTIIKSYQKRDLMKIKNNKNKNKKLQYIGNRNSF